MKKLIFGFATVLTFGASAVPFNMTYNSENPFYQPREKEFSSKTQVEWSWTKLQLRGATNVANAPVDENRDIKSTDLFINERVGFGVSRQLELFAETGWIKDNLTWENLEMPDKAKVNSTDWNYIHVGASYILTRSTDFTAKLSANYGIAPDNDTAGYGDKINVNLVVGKEYQNLVLALHGGLIFNLSDSENIDYFGLNTEMEIPNSVDYMIAGELMYGFNQCFSANLMVRLEMFNPESEQNLNFLNNETAKEFGTDKFDNVLTIAGQLNYSVTKNILLALYAGMSFHSLDKYSVVDPWDAATLAPVVITDLAPAFRNYNIDKFSTTYVGMKFNIAF